MKKIIKLVIVFGCLLGLVIPVQAIPTLQLDILGGSYDSASETIIAPGSNFTLYAFYYDTDRGQAIPPPQEGSFFISAALIPNTTSQINGGSFNFDGSDIDVTSGMDSGTPSGGLGPHGIFNTFFLEFQFTFSGSQINPYDTQTRALSGGIIPSGGTGMYYETFDISTTGLSPGYNIHFDLYHRTNEDIDQFAPFSHDAQSNNTSVPEPTTLMLVGFGLIGIGFVSRRKFGK